jgi:hypothetical protein
VAGSKSCYRGIIHAIIWKIIAVWGLARSPHPEQMEVRVSANIMAMVFLDKMRQEEARPLFEGIDHSYR